MDVGGRGGIHLEMGKGAGGGWASGSRVYRFHGWEKKGVRRPENFKRGLG